MLDGYYGSFSSSPRGRPQDVRRGVLAMGGVSSNGVDHTSPKENSLSPRFLNNSCSGVTTLYQNTPRQYLNNTGTSSNHSCMGRSHVVFLTSDVWARNAQYSCWSILLYLVFMLTESDCSSILAPYEMISVVLQATIGILVALVILHGGAVEKCIAQASSIALTALFEHVSSHTTPKLLEVFILAIVTTSVLGYALLSNA